MTSFLLERVNQPVRVYHSIHYKATVTAEIFNAFLTHPVAMHPVQRSRNDSVLTTHNIIDVPRKVVPDHNIPLRFLPVQYDILLPSKKSYYNILAPSLSYDIIIFIIRYFTPLNNLSHFMIYQDQAMKFARESKYHTTPAYTFRS